MASIQAKRRKIGRSIVERNTNLGAAITAARLKCRLTQHELADRLGISIRTLGRYEAGRRLPPANILAAFSRETRMSNAKLMDMLTRLQAKSEDAA